MSKPLNLIGIRFDKLVVIERISDVVLKNGKHLSNWRCLCDCGNIRDVTGTKLTSRRISSCRNCSKSPPHNFTDITGLRFSRWTVLTFDKYRSSWKCLCDCGNVSYVKTHDLTSGHSKSCGCFCAELNSKTNFKSLVGQTFGRLTVISREKDHIQPNGSKNRMYKCLCSCGSVVIVRAASLRLGTTLSCGCLKSKGEEFISKYLKSKNIPFIKEKTFENCLSSSGHRVRFDFEIFPFTEKSFLIEFQREQHFKEIKNAENFGKRQRKETDRLKKEYCKTHNIPLFEICFNENIEKKLEEILNISHADSVPSQIHKSGRCNDYPEKE